MAPKHDTFISYRRENGADTARLLKAALTGRGFKPFLDVDDLGAAHFDDRLLRTIEQTPNFIVVLSAQCLDRCRNDGDWLRREIGHAIATDRNVVPVYQPGFRFPERDDLPPGMDRLSHSF